MSGPNSVHEAFEQFIAKTLQCCVNFLGEGHSCEEVRVHTRFLPSAADTRVFFVSGGRLYEPQQADVLRVADDYSATELAQDVKQPAEELGQAFRALIGKPEDRPVRIVADYDLQEGRLAADWSYEETDASDEALQKWIAELGR